MFAIVEKHRRLSQILLAGVSITFIGFGAETLSSGIRSNYIGKIGDTTITAEEVQDVVRAAHRSGNNDITNESVFQSLVQQAYIEQGAMELGVGELSVEQIKNVIARDPSFQTNGQFNPELLRAYLSQNGLSEEQLITNMRRQYRRQTLLSLLSNGSIVSNSQAEQLLGMINTERELRTAPFKASDYAARVQPTDAALKTYFDANKTRYALPLAVKLEYIELSLEELAKQQTVSTQELQEAYQNLPTAGSEAKPSFDSVKAQLEESVRQRKAAQAMGKAREELEQLAFDHPDSLQKVAEQMKLPLQKQDEWLSEPDVSASQLPDAVKQAIFSPDVIERRHNSELLDMGNGVLRIVRATDVSKARNQSFEEAKDNVRRDYVAAESAKLAQAAAAEALGKLQAGQAVAALQWGQVEKVGANQLQQNLGMENFSAIVKARPQNGKPGYALVTLPGSGAALVEVRSVSLPENSKEQLPQLRQLAGQRNGEQFYTQFLRGLEQKFPLRSGNQKLNQEEQ
ncbi:SurA N-terminal domain-containing protein [Eikenella sp. S3360]|uniref:SurA N-terminal domain-containing protein n=1 Tax=Eikenella glucosivorans TaxID=2766967 RepID=A0ABS0NB00_9NEIS|nr:peptidylprolyl isomerase [Eikenella glucosivorans]MBH5329464.1 SurA N-terminal domain-containing protein [Eikenella glucosivorans]